MAAPTSLRYSNWPDAAEHNIPYKAPPKGANPAVRGFVLSAGAPLVEKLGFVANFLYKNAEFTGLRKLDQLQDVKQRYDPTVIPVVSEADRAAAKIDHADVGLAGQSLLKKAGDGEEKQLFYSVRDYHEMFKSGSVTPTIVARTLLPLIKREGGKKKGEHSVAFIASQEDIVLAAAEASTKRWAEGKPLGLLDGVPLAVKDEVDLEGYTKSFGSKHTFYKGIGTSWSVKQWEEAGAVIIGKTNMHEIGMDTNNNNPTTGTPLNPYNEKYYTGGSSGGSAYAVASGLVPVALGRDGGGSIRIPSNYCGIYGLKTSHSRVSDNPSPDLAGTTAVSGPMAADMESLAIAYRVMANPDPKNSASLQFGQPRRITGPRAKKIGIFRPWYENCDKAVRSACDAAVEYLKTKAGYEIIDIHLPLVTEGQLAHALTILMEVYNGIPKKKSFLQPANRILMAVGNCATANDFLNAQKVRQILMQHLAYLYETHGEDLIIVSPTTPNVGWSYSKADLKVGSSDGDMSIRNMQYIWLANFTGIPAITAPVGYAEPKKGKGNIPVGLMGMGIWGGEEGLIEFGFELEKYLHEVVEGGRAKPKNWVDVLKLATEPEEKDDEKSVEPVAESVGGKSTEKAETVVPAAPVPVVESKDAPASTEAVKATTVASDSPDATIPAAKAEEKALPAAPVEEQTAVDEKKEVVVPTETAAAAVPEEKKA